MAMNDSTWTDLIATVHTSEHPTVLAITGGGSGAISQLLAVPGSSRTVLEAIVPYASTALADWLGSAAQQSCSAPTARAMAMASWMRARSLSPETDPHGLVGLGATASLVSNRPKRGGHRVHVALQTATTTATYSLVLAKDQRDRLAEESLATQIILLSLAEACELDTTDARAIFKKQLKPNEQPLFSQQQAEASCVDLLLGKRQVVCYPKSLQPQEPKTIFPGAFNPLHAGHKRIASVAAKRLGCPVAYELSITNVDKPPLDYVDLEERVRGLRGEDASVLLLITDAPTFRAKAALFPGCTFVVGADTIARIADPKYYSGEAESFDAAIEQIAEQGCRFLVFGREIEGTFQVLSDIELPSALLELCEEVSADEFREDVSSTEHRSVVRLSES